MIRQIATTDACMHVEVGTGVRLCCETFGETGDPPVLMIMGLGTQMLGWDEELCGMLAESGHFVIRFDNRDIGHSTELDFRPPSMTRLATRRFRSEQYTLADMADDAVGLLEALGIESAHLVGASMGGMIAQTIAIRYPERTRSLVSIMSTTGSLRVGQPSLSILGQFLRRPPAERDAYIEHMTRFFEMVGSRGQLRDVERARTVIARARDRSFRPRGTARQLGAILASGDRTRRLRGLEVPATVVHGTADRLVTPSGARATAAAIPDSRLVMIEDMGHDLPRPIWPKLVATITETTRRNDRSGAIGPSNPS